VRVDCSDFYQKPPTLARRPSIPSPYSCLRPSITYIDSRMAFSIPLYVYVPLSLSLSPSLFLSFCLHWSRYIIQLSTYESPQTSPRGVSRYHGGGEKMASKETFQRKNRSKTHAGFVYPGNPIYRVLHQARSSLFNF